MDLLNSQFPITPLYNGFSQTISIISCRPERTEAKIQTVNNTSVRSVESALSSSPNSFNIGLLPDLRGMERRRPEQITIPGMKPIHCFDNYGEISLLQLVPYDLTKKKESLK